MRNLESLANIFCLFFSVFDLPSKLRVVHIRKKFKIFIFSKMALTIFIKFCEFIVHSNSTIWHYRLFPKKSLKLKKKLFLICYPSPNVATKPTDQSCSNSIFRVPLQISPASFIFYFRPTLKIKVTLHKKQANQLSDKHWILQTWSIVFCCSVIKLAGETAKKALLCHLKSTAYRNKSLSN